MESFTKADKRTHYCGTLTSANIGERVTVTGWCQRQRDLGSLIFIDLRDRTGIVQLAFDDATDREIFDKAFGIRAEFVLSASGVVRSRGEAAINKNIPTGEIEVYVDALKILTTAQTPPFAIVTLFIITLFYGKNYVNFVKFLLFNCPQAAKISCPRATLIGAS